MIVPLPVCQEFPAVSVLELLVRANITVKSSIKHLVLKDAAAQVLSGSQNLNYNVKLKFCKCRILKCLFKIIKLK